MLNLLYAPSLSYKFHRSGKPGYKSVERAGSARDGALSHTHPAQDGGLMAGAPRRFGGASAA